MGILKRLKALFSGMAHKTTDRLESNKPEWLIADAEEKIKKSRKEAEKQLIEIQTWTEMIRLDMREAETALDQVREKIDMTVQEGDKELLAELLLQEDDYKSYYYTKKELFDSAVAEAIRVRDNYRQFEAQMNEKTRMLKNIKSQAQLAEIRSRILELDDAYGSRSELAESMDRLRFAVNEQSARIMATEQIRRDKVDTKVSDLEYSIKWKKAMERARALLEKG